ncbi:hypothetical protein LTS18_009466, partial [Coniosporium uncinatum]
DIERLFYRLLGEDAIEEENHLNKAGFASQYIRLGKKCNEFQPGRRQLKLQVRVSPCLKAAKPKAKKAAKGKGKNAVSEYPLSTNVSSPVQAAASRKRKASSNDYDGGGEMHPNGYYRDSFVVADNDESEDSYFEPVREAGKSRTKRKEPRELGPPITTDEKMANLSDVHRVIVEAFVTEGREVCRKIMNERQLRKHPFTDTVLREMAINFPSSVSEMNRIPDINEEMVKIHSKSFLHLIKRYHDTFEQMMQPQEERDHDPNHKNVIDLVTDDEEAEEEAEEDDYGDIDFDDETESSQEQRSSYFDPSNGPGPATYHPPAHIAQFNSQIAQSQRAAPASSAKSKTPTGRGDTTGGSTYKKNGYYGKGKRKASGTGSRSTSGAVKKGVTAKKKSSAAPKRSTGGGGGGFGGGIGMMPV